MGSKLAGRQVKVWCGCVAVQGRCKLLTGATCNFSARFPVDFAVGSRLGLPRVTMCLLDPTNIVRDSCQAPCDYGSTGMARTWRIGPKYRTLITIVTLVLN